MFASGCGSFSATTPVEKSEDSDVATESLQVTKKKLPAQAQFLYDLTYQKSILSTCKRKNFIGDTGFGNWYQYSDCKFKFLGDTDHRITLNVHVGNRGKSIDAVSYMEFASTKDGQRLLELYGDGAINETKKYCSVYGIGAHSIVKFVKPELCTALIYKLV